VVLMNGHTAAIAQARIVFDATASQWAQIVGLEFISPSENFWRLPFVKPGANIAEENIRQPQFLKGLLPDGRRTRRRGAAARNFHARVQARELRNLP